jgi:hypothetical protein
MLNKENRSVLKIFKETNQAQLDLMHDHKAYMGATKDYTLNDSPLFKKLYDKHIRLGETRKRARMLASAEEQSLKRLSRAKRVSVIYKHGREIIGKVEQFTHRHLVLKVRSQDKPLWLDRRYIGLVKML